MDGRNLLSALRISCGYAVLATTILLLLILIGDIFPFVSPYPDDQENFPAQLLPLALFGTAAFVGLYYIPILSTLLWPNTLRYVAWVLALVSAIWPLYVLFGINRAYCEALDEGIVIEGKGIALSLAILTVFVVGTGVLVQGLERGARKATVISQKQYSAEAFLCGVPIIVWAILSATGFGYVFNAIYGCA